MVDILFVLYLFLMMVFPSLFFVGCLQKDFRNLANFAVDTQCQQKGLNPQDVQSVDFKSAALNNLYFINQN